MFWVHFLSLVLSLAIDYFFSFFFRGKGKRRRMSHGIPFTFLSFIALHTRDGRKKSPDDKKRNFLRVSEDDGIIITANKRRFFAVVSPGNKDL